LTGGHVSLNVEKIINKDQITRPENQSGTLNWKKALSDVVASELDQVISLRNWSTLSQKLKKLCPETEWYFIREEDKYSNDKELISLTWEWINKVIANPAWPFPERITCSIESKKSERFIRFAIMSSEGVIPFVSPPQDLCVAPWKKDQTHGWKVFTLPKSQIKKSGKA
jgi:hypothetical protein